MSTNYTTYRAYALQGRFTMKFLNFKRSAFGVQCSCYGLGMIGFVANPKDINNKFNKGSNILRVVSYSLEKNMEETIKEVVLGDYVDLNTLFDYIKRFKFSTPVDISFYAAKRGRKERPYLMGAFIC